MKRVVAVLAVLSAPSPLWAGEPDARRQRQLDSLLSQDCGSCHGMTLKGGLGAPLTVEAMRELGDEALVATILDGRPGTPMPPWKLMLSEADARWLVRRLKGEVP